MRANETTETKRNQIQNLLLSVSTKEISKILKYKPIILRRWTKSQGEEAQAQAQHTTIWKKNDSHDNFKTACRSGIEFVQHHPTLYCTSFDCVFIFHRFDWEIPQRAEITCFMLEKIKQFSGVGERHVQFINYKDGAYVRLSYTKDSHVTDQYVVLCDCVLSCPVFNHSREDESLLK